MKPIAFACIISIALVSCSSQGGSETNSSSSSKYKSIFQYYETKIEKPIKSQKINLAPENKFILRYMEQFYEEYRPESDCWMTPESEGTFRYCMEIKRVKNVQIRGVEYKFVEANGLFVNHRNQVDPNNAPHVAPGVSGLFVFAKQGNDWHSVSNIPIFESESWGYSGIDEKSFSRFGPEVYGWKISDGGMWQGQITENVFFVALINNQLLKVLDFPVMFNADGFGNEDLIKNNFKNEISIIESKNKNNMFFLRLVHKSRDINKSYELSFDSDKKIFIYPKDIAPNN